MQEFYVSTVRFCALVLEILWKMYATEFCRCIDICDCVNGWASFSDMSAIFSASEEDKFCHEYAVRAPS